MRYLVFSAIAVLLLLAGSLSAYMNVTYLNTTVILNQNTSARVVEIFSIYVSNSSVSQYIQDRQAINPTVTSWQQALNTNLLVEHILNPMSSVYNFKILPGPIQPSLNGGNAKLEISYYVSNVTGAMQIAPREFMYSLNDSVFNYLHTASGEALPVNARLNIILPQGASIVSLYPLPDYPQFSFIGNYSGISEVSWFSGEPLSNLSLKYVTYQSLETEVLQYFSGVYSQYSLEIVIAAAAAVALYIFFYVRKISGRS